MGSYYFSVTIAKNKHGANCTTCATRNLIMLLSLANSQRAHGNGASAKRGAIMAISEQLLEILVCPACRAKVELKPDGSGLKCVECKRVYPIRDDIPVMLIDEAKIEDE